MEVLVIALWSFAVALAGGVAGLVLGNLRLPLLLQFASSPAAGAGANIAVSGLSTLTASSSSALTKYPQQRRRLDLLYAGALGAIPGAYLGAQLTGRLDDEALLKVISAILVVAGLVLGAEAAIG